MLLSFNEQQAESGFLSPSGYSQSAVWDPLPGISSSHVCSKIDPGHGCETPEVCPLVATQRPTEKKSSTCFLRLTAVSTSSALVVTGQRHILVVG